MNQPHLDQLLDRHFDGALSAADRAELEGILLSSSEARAAFWDRARIHAGLRKIARQNHGLRLAEEQNETDAHPPAEPPPRRVSRLAYGLAAAAMIALGLPAYLYWPQPDEPPRPFVAMVEYSSAPNLPQGKPLPDKDFRIHAGVVQLRLADGTLVVAQGPAHFEFTGATLLHLHEGRLKIEATQAVTVKAGTASVTGGSGHFGVRVKADGAVVAQVFEGGATLAGADSVLPLGPDQAGIFSGGSWRTTASLPAAFPSPARELAVELAGNGFEPGSRVLVNLPGESPQNQAPVRLGGEGFEPGSMVRNSKDVSSKTQVWSGDPAEVSGPLPPVFPRTGRGMLHFLQVGSLPERSIDQWQLVDLRPHRALIASGQCRAEFAVWVNGTTTGHFATEAIAWKGDAGQALAKWTESRQIPLVQRARGQVRTDPDPSTWEKLSFEAPLAEDADYLLIHIGVGNEEGTLYAPGRQFADDPTLTLIVPPLAGSPQIAGANL